MRPLDAQQEHDLENEDRPLKLVPKAEFEALVNKGGKPSSSGESYDLIATAMRQHNLTREQAIEELDAFGF